MAPYAEQYDGSYPPYPGPNGQPVPPRDRGPVNGQGYASRRANDQSAYGSPPGRNRMPDTGPMPAYPPANGSRPGYVVTGSGPMPVYRNSGPMAAYQPTDGSRTDYVMTASGPMPLYQPTDGSRPGYVMTASGPMPVYRPAAEAAAPLYQLLDSGPKGVYQPPVGRSLIGWLPFGNRLVLLPKNAPMAGGDGELREHRDISGGWLRPAVFGAMDGLVTNSSLIAGIGGGGAAHGMIVLTGVAGLIAGAFSMATGEYISVKSQNELTQAEVDLERRQHARDPVGKMKRLTDVYIEKKGVSPNLAEAVVRQISSDPERAVEAHVREELGIDPDDLPSPQTAAIASFASFTVGALIPLSPFLLGHPVLKVALVLAGLSAVVGGAAVAKLAGRSMLMGGLRQFTAAFLATGAALAIGHVIGTHVTG